MGCEGRGLGGYVPCHSEPPHASGLSSTSQEVSWCFPLSDSSGWAYVCGRDSTGVAVGALMRWGARHGGRQFGPAQPVEPQLVQQQCLVQGNWQLPTAVLMTAHTTAPSRTPTARHAVGWPPHPESAGCPQH